MKKLIYGFIAFFTIFFVYVGCFNVALEAKEDSSILAEDEYAISLTLYVPQVRNNSTSMGTRRIELQRITGMMYVDWLSNDSYTISFGTLTNKHFKVADRNVTYVGQVETDTIYPSFTYIGSNQSGIFTKPVLSFYCSLLPSYAIGEVSEDNSFYLYLAGRGTSIQLGGGEGRVMKRITGNVVGTQGCGCYDYGHKSPTRAAGVTGPTDRVVDIVSTYGRWTAKFQRRIYAY